MIRRPTVAQPSGLWISSVAESSDPASQWVTSPGLVKKGAAWFASHDWSIPPNNGSGDTLIYRSTDDGLTWQQRLTISQGQWTSNLVLMPDGKQCVLARRISDGALVIFISSDDWLTEPPLIVIDSTGDWGTSGPLRWHFEDGYFLMSIRHEGNRIAFVWCDQNDMANPASWGWVDSEAYDSGWNDPNWRVETSWSEPQLVKIGSQWVISCRVTTFWEHITAQLFVNWDSGNPGATTIDAFNPATGFVYLPGGGILANPSWDSVLQRWWLVTSHRDQILDTHNFGHPNPDKNRDQMWLISSDDYATFPIHFRDQGASHEVAWAASTGNQLTFGMQYACTFIDGNDLCYASRTAARMSDGRFAINQHDATQLTFHRIENFRVRAGFAPDFSLAGSALAEVHTTATLTHTPPGFALAGSALIEVHAAATLTHQPPDAALAGSALIEVHTSGRLTHVPPGNHPLRGAALIKAVTSCDLTVEQPVASLAAGLEWTAAIEKLDWRAREDSDGMSTKVPLTYQGASERGAVDFSDWLDSLELLDSASVAGPPDLTITEAQVTTEPMEIDGRTVDPGRGIRFKLSGQLAGKVYPLTVIAGSNQGRSVPYPVEFECR